MAAAKSSGVAEARAAFSWRSPAAPLAAGYLDRAGDVDVEQVMDRFGLSRVQLAETAGLSRDTFQKAARAAAPKARARLVEMLEILGRVCEWAGGQAQAMAWYRSQPIPSLGGRTAEALVKSGDATLVRDYLDQIALGGFA